MVFPFFLFFHSAPIYHPSPSYYQNKPKNSIPKTGKENGGIESANKGSGNPIANQSYGYTEIDLPEDTD